MTKKVRVWRTPGSAINQMAVENEFQFRDRVLEGRETLGGGAVEHDADHHQRALADPARRDHRADLGDKPFVEQALGPAMTGRGADPGRLRQLGIAQSPVILQQTQYLKVDAVEPAAHGRIFHESVQEWTKTNTICYFGNERTKIMDPIREHLSRVR